MNTPPLSPPLYDLGPLAGVVLVGVVCAAGPLLWLWWRHRSAPQPGARLRALTLATLFLTFDLVLFGAYTRLSDSGLGCPDWPGCYGSASPLGAHEQIRSAHTALPSGPVSHAKAWVEMTHRYLAVGVGVLITLLALASWRARRQRPRAAWWAGAALVWVCVQGAFGALTVTMKLYPAIVTAHLLGAMVLLVLLAAQVVSEEQAPLRVPAALARGVIAVAMLVALQIALGAWVSTNYAVLACTDFPTCQGRWWPAMDFEQGYTLARALGEGSEGWLPFAALTAIHYTHRLAAYLVLVALLLLAWRLHRAATRANQPALRRWAWALGGAAAWQFATGLSNIVFGWPLVGALAHTAGAALLVTLLTLLIVRIARARSSVRAPQQLGAAATLAS